MTTIDQIKALAELDEKLDLFLECLEISKAQVRGEDWQLPHAIALSGCNYLGSYAAIIPLIQKQGGRIQVEIAQQFQDEHKSISNQQLNLLLAKPSQLCEALLRATGKWVDSPPIDWSAIPERFRFAAMDASGIWFAYVGKPVPETNNHFYYEGESERINPTHVPAFPGDWKQSLTERPNQ